MKQLVSINLTTKSAKDWTPPVVTFGESLTLALRFYKNSGGAEMEAGIDVSSLKASIGRVDTRPEGGQFALKIGNSPVSTNNTTALLNFNDPVGKLAAGINAVPAAEAYGEARVVAADGSWLIFFGEQEQAVPMQVVHNALSPVSYGRINAWQVDGKWVHEVRLTQAPVAFTSMLETTLPPMPAITRIQAGGEYQGFVWNEIQQLYIPPDFRGAFIVKMGYAKTGPLSVEDDIFAIQEALQSLGADCWKVTLPLSNKPAIEFIGEYGGQAMDLLVAEVTQAPPGDPTFTLALDRAELAAALRRATSVTLPMEIRVHGTDESGFEGELCALVLPVTIRQPVIFPELEEVPAINLLRPHSPKSYIPFGENNTLTGQRYYRAVVGDGERTEFAVATGLDSEDVYVFVRENQSGGRQLVDGTDFSVTIESANEITVTALGEAPAENAWAVVVLSAESVAAWANGLTVTAPQVVSGSGYLALPAFMDDVGERLDRLEELLPRAGAAGVNVGPPLSFEVPSVGEILPDLAAMSGLETIASQTVVTTQSPVYPEGTPAASLMDRLEEAQKAVEKDPDALPANVLYRATVPGIGATAVKGSDAVLNADGSVKVPATPAEPSEPAVWPMRSATMAKAGRWPMLLPAVESDEPETFATAAVLPAMTAGAVWICNDANGVMLPGGGGRKSQFVKHGEHFASDGRCFYRVVGGDAGWWHPAEMDRELWRVFVGEEQFSEGAVLSVAGELRTRLLGEFFDDDARGIGRVDVAAQYLLKCEAVPVAGPMIVGEVSTPVLLGQTRVALSPSLETFKWSLSIHRESSGMVSSWMAYRRSAAGGNFALPATIRLRLTAFDLDDDSPDPRGQIALIMPATKLEITL